MFHVEVVSKQYQRFKPRFFANKNLFFVKNVDKTNFKINKHSMKLSKILKNQRKNNQKNFLKKRYRFITHKKEIKPLSSKIPLDPKLKPKPKIDETKISNFIKEKNKYKFSVIRTFPRTNENPKPNNSSLNFPKKVIRHFNNNGKYISGRWSVEEHKKFLEAIVKYGNDWKEVQKHIGTRSSSQARSHAQKFFIKLKQDQLKSKTTNEIDYSNSSIKSFHDTLQSLSQEKREKIIKELENVIFDKETKSHVSYNYSTSVDFYNSVSEYINDDTIMVGEENERSMEIEEKDELEEKNKKFFERRKNSDSLDEIRNIRFFDEFDNYNNGHFTEEEYEKSFNMVFSDKEGVEFEAKSRKISEEDDFMYNIKI